MRIRIPPLLPPYIVLALVITYAVGSLWLGLARIDAITQLTEAAAENAATAKDLNDLLAAVNDIENAGRGYALTADESYLEPFERGRRRVPALLSELRDKMRDDKVELALIEDLVSLIAERTTITVTGIERKRNAPDKPYTMTFGRRGKESAEEIRKIVATLEAREQDELSQLRQTLAKALDEARGDLYLMAGVTMLLVISLFLAVRRLRSFIHMPIIAGAGREPETAPTPASGNGAEIGTLLNDALLRARLAAASASADPDANRRQHSLVRAVEQALAAQSTAQEHQGAEHESPGVVDAMFALAHAYSTPGGLTIKTTIDRKIRVEDSQKAFLVLRSAEWALEAITLRKRTGEVTLSLNSGDGRIALHVQALTDNPRPTLTLSPNEAEEANALRQGTLALAGALVVDEGPTGFSLTLAIPA